MKHLVLHHGNYNELVKAFATHLSTKGYSKGSQSMLPSCIQEFLYRMEQKGVFHFDEILPQHIQEHYQYLTKRPNNRKEGGLSAVMLSHHVYSIRVFFGWLQQMGAIEINPISGLDFPRLNFSKREALSKEQIKSLYEVSENLRDKAILNIYYGCGLRRSEAQQLNRADIDFNAQKLIVRSGKFNKRREVPLHPVIIKQLKDYWLYERTTYITSYTSDNMKAFLVNNNGTRMSGNTANIRINELAHRAKIEQPVSPHVLRHSIATHLKQNGMPIEQIRDFLGHGSLDVTQAYMDGYRPQWRNKKYRKFQSQEE